MLADEMDRDELLAEVERLRKELELLRAELPKMCERVREQVAEESWVVPKIPHDQGAPVGPRIMRDGWIRREAGESDVDHTRVYAAQLLAAADRVDAAIRASE
jgi:hypothetical protein